MVNFVSNMVNFVLCIPNFVKLWYSTYIVGHFPSDVEKLTEKMLIEKIWRRH